jgi:inhibitor of KinA sporulation pathway (predicted exonuclease)
MNYLVTDLECNCTDKNEFPREEMEIIEIGAVLLNEKLEIIAEFSSFVKPTIHPILTSFCKELTKIKQEYVDSEEHIDKAIVEFEKWASEKGDYTFFSWGAFDYNQIQRECDLKKITNPMFQRNMNYKKNFAKIKKLKRGVGVRKALNILNMKFEGTPHRAIDDTRNIVKMIQKVGLK